MPKVIHFEIPLDNPERATSFYSKTFGWKIDKYAGPEDYWLVTAGEEKEIGINGAFMRRGEAQMSQIGLAIGVPSVDDFLKKLAQNGGKALTPKMPIPGVGYVAYFQDTEGNYLSIYQPDPSAK